MGEGCCDGCKRCFGESMIMLFNVIDCLFGLMTIGFGGLTASIADNFDKCSFLVFGSLILGFSLVLTATFSMLGNSFKMLECCFTFGAHFGLFLGVLSLIFGVILLSDQDGYKNDVISDDDDLSSSQKSWESWFDIFPFVLIGLFIEEGLRFFIQRCYRRLKLASGGEKERLIEKEEREIVERRENKKDEAKEKWDGKREYFKNKYNKKNDNQPTPSLINNANSNAYRPPEYTINSSDLKEQSPTPPPNKPYNPFEDV